MTQMKELVSSLALLILW